jgi:drug/metabolite transporter (DMT)-like permease
MWLFSFSKFTVGTALSKTEVVQVVVLEAIVLHEMISGLATSAVVVATAGVLIMTAGKSKLSVASLVSGLRQKSTMIGLACGFFLGLSAVLFRGALLSLEGDSILAKSAYTLAIATVFQSIVMSAWLYYREPGQITRTFINWRHCATVGFAGWIASICWFIAFTLTNAAFVRALGQIELLFTFLASVLIFREKVSRKEIVGVVLLIVGIVVLVLEKTY